MFFFGQSMTTLYLPSIYNEYFQSNLGTCLWYAKVKLTQLNTEVYSWRKDELGISWNILEWVCGTYVISHQMSSDVIKCYSFRRFPKLYKITEGGFPAEVPSGLPKPRRSGRGQSLGNSPQRPKSESRAPGWSRMRSKCQGWLPRSA